ncbi:hypothetical protein [Paractinoplanes brasiliensis]|uniref:Uncharacterized protein n=1 Tax=Paractinoplanes brasiliensis TaxID=52695 RepID=A0A4R6JYZ6_9ACTN|nr:hypothetical protein [Actinoplanes brasiliensis]TDO42113.1 hypothetical protein C8E87_5876 [Actinoplanes brasiliensis]
MIEPTAQQSRRVIHGDISQIAGRSWTHGLFWVVLLAAGGVDVVTFYQVLILVLNVPPLMVTIAVAGFALVALTLAHYAGLQARATINPRNITGSKTLALVLGGTWALLGLTAFVVRLVLEPAGGSAGASTFTTESGAVTDDLGTGGSATPVYLSALLFLVLYIATGVVASLAGYFRQEPAARQFGRAATKRTTAATKHADTHWELSQAEQVWVAISRARERREAAMAQVDRQFEATANRLRADAELIIANNRNAARAVAPAGSDDPTVPIPLPSVAYPHHHPISVGRRRTTEEEAQ